MYSSPQASSGLVLTSFCCYFVLQYVVSAANKEVERLKAKLQKMTTRNKELEAAASK